MKKIIISLLSLIAISVSAQEMPTSFPRKFLIEHFTGERCGYCPGGMFSIVEYLQQSKIPHIWVSHHYGYNTDEYTIPENSKIGDVCGVSGAPNIAINRTKIMGSAVAFHPGYLAKENVLKAISEQCDTTAEASVVIDHTYNVDTRELSVTVSGQVADTSATKYLLTVLIKENGLVGAQSDNNYALNKTWKEFMHPRVVRDVITAPLGDTVVVSNQTYSKTLTYTVSNKWIPENCCIVAYITPLSKKPIINAEQVAVIAGTEGGEQYNPYGITEAGNPQKSIVFDKLQVTPIENNQLEVILISNDSIRTNRGWTNPVCILYLNTDSEELKHSTYPIQSDNQIGTITAGYRVDEECALGGSLLVYALSSYLQQDQIAVAHMWRMNTGNMVVDIEGDLSLAFKTYSGATVTANYHSDVAVKNIRFDETNAQKIIRDGRLIIISNETEYDALGNTMK